MMLYIVTTPFEQEIEMHERLYCGGMKRILVLSSILLINFKKVIDM